MSRAVSREPRRRRRAVGPSSPSTADIELLARVPYFASLQAAELRELASRCASRTFGLESSLFEEGDPCHGLFIIVEGAVEVRQVSLRGREQVFHTEGPGATPGEGPLFDRGGCIASAMVTKPTRALFLRRADLLDLCRRHPDVALAILQALARRLRHFAEMVSDLAFRPIPERLARYLEALPRRPGGTGTDVELDADSHSARREARHGARARRPSVPPARAKRRHHTEAQTCCDPRRRPARKPSARGAVTLPLAPTPVT